MYADEWKYSGGKRSGKGATFTVRLPLPVEEKRTPGEETKTRYQLPSLRVLVAEDDRVSRDIVRAHLRRAGCEVTVAEDGQKPWIFCVQKHSMWR